MVSRRVWGRGGARLIRGCGSWRSRGRGRGGRRAEPRGIVPGAVAKRGTGVQCERQGAAEREDGPAHLCRVNKPHIVTH